VRGRIESCGSGLSDHAPPDDNSPDDARLIGRTLAGEPAAFGQLVLRYQDRLYNALVRVLGSAGTPATWSRKPLCKRS